MKNDENNNNNNNNNNFIVPIKGPRRGRELHIKQILIQCTYNNTISEVAPAKKHCRRRWKVIMSLHNWLKTGSLKRKLDEGNFQNISVDLHIPISVTLLS
jgi:hypothetical protein